MKNQTKARSYKGFDFLARMRRGSLHLTVAKNGITLDFVPANCASPDQALQDASLDQALAKVLANPAAQKKLGRLAAKAEGRAAAPRPLRVVLQGLKVGGEESAVGRGKEFISDALAPNKEHPDDIREYPIDLIPYERYYPVRDRLDAAEMSDESKYQMATLLARMTTALIEEGLDWHCEDLFEGFKSKLAHEAAGVAITYDQIRRILEVVPEHPFSSQFLWWLEYSAGPDLLDAAALEIAKVCPETGKVELTPKGTIDSADFALVSEGLQCYRREMPKFVPGQVYTNPNWIYTTQEQQKAGYLLERVDLSQRWRRDHIRKMAGEAWDKLLGDAKVEGITFGSVCKEVYAFLSSMEVKSTVLAKMMGVSLDALRRYGLPAEWEFFCLRDLREKHLAAIRRGEQGEYVISKSQVLAEVNGFIDDYAKALVRMSAKAPIRVRRHAAKAFQGVADTAKQGVTDLQRAQATRRVEAALKIKGALNNTIELENRLMDLRLELAAEYGFDDFNLQ